MVSTAFDVISAKGTNNRGDADRLRQKYLLLALDRPDQFPVDLEVSLVMKQRPASFSTGVPDKNEIDRKLDLLFHAWTRMERETDPAFDPSGETPPDGTPPIWETLGNAGQSWFSGMDPAFIRDARLRDAYIAALKRESVRAEAFRVQLTLRNNKKPFIRHSEAFLVSALQTGAVTEGEVLSRLSLVQGDAARDQVISKIRSRSNR